MAVSAPVVCLPYAESPTAAVAAAILDRHAGTLPDLTGCTILIPDLQAAPALRRALLAAAAERGHAALLGPDILTLRTWLHERVAMPRPVLAQAAQELVMVEAVRDARHLFNADDPWVVSGELLDLFGELTLANAEPGGYPDFQDRLARAYGIAADLPTPFGTEARMVHRLWQAWHEQLDAQEQLDPAQAHLLRLAGSLATPGDERLWLVGLTELAPAECDWLRRLLDDGRAHLFLSGLPEDGDTAPGALLRALGQRLGQAPHVAATTPSPLGRFLDAVFTPDTGTLAERAAAFTLEHAADPVTGAIATLAADSAEQEARAVALQVRRWLLDGLRPIGILTEDRRLARRVRALLERAGLALEDAGGWALSTTSAAAALERWLETLEEDFAQASLLDALKSPFVCLFDDRDRHLRVVRRLEQDVILHENIARGLHRYRKHARLRAARLQSWNSETLRDIETLLNRLDHAAEPVRALLAGRHPAADFVPALRASLDELGMRAAFDADPAGRRVLQELQTLETAGRQHPLPLDWREFRGWLGGTLERFTFQPETGASPIQLMTLRQSALQRFEGVVIAGCTAAQLPGGATGQAFFNDAVRVELGLSTWHDRYLAGLYHFRRTLECAPRVLLTWRREDAGEPVQPSPWVELIDTFHTLAYRQPLTDGALAALLAHAATEPVADTDPLPRPVAPHPAPALPGALLPARWSAASYQRLMDCPYRYFAADGLRLKARDEIREKLEKAEFGEYVHRILNAFHTGEKSLPGPFAQRLSESNRAEALRLLETISRKVFAEAVVENFEARGWLARWLDAAPAYLDWQAAREARWRVRSGEQALDRSWADGTRLIGRADRIDEGDGGLAILDYKTGAVPRATDVEDGEAVQLPCYAMMERGPVTEARYVRIQRDKVDSGVGLEGEALHRLADANAARLRELNAAIAQQRPLPAWGDHKVCTHCDFAGLCRRQAWDEDGDG